LLHGTPKFASRSSPVRELSSNPSGRRRASTMTSKNLAEQPSLQIPRYPQNPPGIPGAPSACRSGLQFQAVNERFTQRAAPSLDLAGGMTILWSRWSQSPTNVSQKVRPCTRPSPGRRRRKASPWRRTAARLSLPWRRAFFADSTLKLARTNANV
jgi:hypothetical protein